MIIIIMQSLKNKIRSLEYFKRRHNFDADWGWLSIVHLTNENDSHHKHSNYAKYMYLLSVDSKHFQLYFLILMC